MSVEKNSCKKFPTEVGKREGTKRDYFFSVAALLSTTPGIS